MIRPTSVFLIKRAESWLLETNPRDEITIENFSNQAWDACLRPYNAFLSLQTYPESCETLYAFLRPYSFFSWYGVSIKLWLGLINDIGSLIEEWISLRT
jgi:hypothetical protein